MITQILHEMARLIGNCELQCLGSVEGNTSPWHVSRCSLPGFSLFVFAFWISCNFTWVWKCAAQHPEMSASMLGNVFWQKHERCGYHILSCQGMQGQHSQLIALSSPCHVSTSHSNLKQRGTLGPAFRMDFASARTRHQKVMTRIHPRGSTWRQPLCMRLWRSSSAHRAPTQSGLMFLPIRIDRILDMFDFLGVHMIGLHKNTRNHTLTQHAHMLAKWRPHISCIDVSVSRVH